jgi:hypothetical protein
MKRGRAFVLGAISATVLVLANAKAQIARSAEADPYYDQYGAGSGYSYDSYTSAYNPYYDPAYDPYYDPYCDYYTPPWGYPPDYCRYRVWYDPVYVGGIWYWGPIYYGVFWGATWFWLNGYWWHDEWHGERPIHHNWNGADHKYWDGQKHNWHQDYANGTWAGRDSWAGRNYGADAGAARRAVTTRNFAGGRDRSLVGRNLASGNRDVTGGRADRREIVNGQNAAANGRDGGNGIDRLTRRNEAGTSVAQNGRRFADAQRTGGDRVTPNGVPRVRNTAPGYGSGLRSSDRQRAVSSYAGSSARSARALESFNRGPGSTRALAGGGSRYVGSPSFGGGPRALSGGAARYGTGLRGFGGGGRAFAGGGVGGAHSVGGGTRSFAGGGGGRGFSGGGGGRR